MVLVLLWGCNSLGAQQPFGRLLQPATVTLDHPLPRTVHTAVLDLAGQTHPSAFLHSFVDSNDLGFTLANDAGRFDLHLPLGDVGSHVVRIDVRYRTADDAPAESLVGTVTRSTDPIPAPRVLAVVPAVAPDTYDLVVATVPGATILSHGATITQPGRDRDIARGRLTIELHREASGEPVTLQAIDDAGGVSGPTQPLDLAALAADGIAQDPADNTVTTVTYRIGRAGVSRVQTIVLDPRRSELKDLTEGRLDILGFLDAVAGRHGLAVSTGKGCLISQSGSGQPDIEIGDRATVTLVDDFPDFITNANGFADRPVVSLCFPDGLPILGDTGHLEVRIADYSVVATSPRPTTISIERSDAGLQEHVYGWDRVPPGGTIALTLAVDVPTSLGLVPKARLGNLITDPAIASLASGIFYALVQGAGLLLLLWLTASRLTRDQFPAGPRRAVSDILTLGVAFALLPAIAQLTTALGYETFARVRTTFSLTFVVADLPAAPGDIGAWFLTILVVAGAGGLAWWFKGLPRPLWAHLSAAVALAAALWLALSFLGRVVMAIAASQGTSEEVVPPLAAWTVGSILMLGTLAFTWRRFSALRLRRRPPTVLGTIALLGWGATAAILLAFPAGRQVPVPGAVGGRDALFDFIMRSFIPLIAYGYALVGVAAVVCLVRIAWRHMSWEQIVLRSIGGRSGRSSADQLLKRLGRVIFAGYVIGTAGVFAVLPIPFLIAFPLFDRLLLRRSSDARRLAQDAARIRSNRTELLEARIPNDGASKGEKEPPESVASAPSGARMDVDGLNPGFPKALVRNVAALGPRRPIWGDIVLGLQVGGILAAGLVLLYITQYPFASVTTADPYYLQRLGLNVAAFVGSWVIIGFFFGMMYEHLRGDSGLRKGLWLGGMILALTLPFQLLSTLASGLPLLTITIRVLQVLAFTVVLGLTFDVWLLYRHGRLRQAGSFVSQVGGVSSTGLFWTGILFIGGSIVGTVGTIITGQLTVLLSRILTPFLPLPPP
jgi:hypothetical protein